MSFVDSGGNHTHVIRNGGAIPASDVAVQFVPAGTARKIDAPTAPPTAPASNDKSRKLTLLLDPWTRIEAACPGIPFCVAPLLPAQVALRQLLGGFQRIRGFHFYVWLHAYARPIGG